MPFSANVYGIKYAHSLAERWKVKTCWKMLAVLACNSTPLATIFWKATPTTLDNGTGWSFQKDSSSKFNWILGPAEGSGGGVLDQMFRMKLQKSKDWTCPVKASTSGPPLFPPLQVWCALWISLVHKTLVSWMCWITRPWLNGHFRNLNCRYLPYIRHYKARIIQGLCKGISPQNMALYGTVPSF